MQASEKVGVTVAARCRPFTEVEQGKGATRIVKMSGDKTTVQNPQQGGSGKVRIITKLMRSFHNFRLFLFLFVRHFSHFIGKG